MRDTTTGHLKPMLRTPQEQIEKLKSLGATFDLAGKAETAAFLAEKTYLFKLIANRDLFERHVDDERDGQYVELDFVQ